MTEEIVVCDLHPERQTPMVWTFAFPGSEYWCPYCGNRGGMLGTGEKVVSTPELQARAQEDKQRAMPYLQAIASLSCVSMEFEGRQVKPEDLPEWKNEEFMKIRHEWRYPAAVAS
jgi:hypothetical protein